MEIIFLFIHIVFMEIFLMTFNFWLAQILGLIALIFVCISYNTNNKKHFLFYQILANIFYASSFLSLNVIVGGINTIISIIRVTCLYFIEKKNNDYPKYLYFIFAISYLTLGILFFESYLDILAIISYEIFNLAMFCKNINKVRYLMILPNVMIVIYNILNQTFTNAILDLVEIAVLCCSIYKFRKYKIDKYINLI